MDFDLVHNDQPLTIRAEVRPDAVVLIDGERKREFPYVCLDQATYVVTDGGKVRRLVAIKEGGTVHVATPGGEFAFQPAPTADSDTFADEHGAHDDKSKLVPPMPGKVVKVLVKQGDTVGKKQKLVIVEAMKMENPVVAPYAAEVVRVNCAEGQLVDTEDILVELKEISAAAAS